jgi:succinate-semialdehyde dehydrogenase/glutarate-semialdehyde dehydrogenase
MTVSEAPAVGPVDPALLSELGGLVTTAGGRERYTVEAPFAGEPLGSLPACGPDDVDLAVERAREAQRAWAGRDPDERAAVVRRFRSRLLDDRGTFIDLVQLETGKSRRNAAEEVQVVAVTAGYYRNRVGSLLATERRKGLLPLVVETEVNRLPVGVCGLITPWNYPLELPVSDAIPALLAGNAVVLKPAEGTAHVALYAKRLFESVGLPGELFQVVTGDGPTLGGPLVSAVDHVGFTGSAAAGREVAGRTGRELTNYSLELGGKNPALVFADADLDRAVPGLVAGAFSNAGQVCIAIERCYVHESRYDEFVERFVDAAESVTVGTGFDFEAEMGSLASEAQLEKVVEHVEDARGKGATVRCGGRARPDVGPYVYEPTVLTDVEPGMTAFEEETFGPVVAVAPFEDVDEAVELANATDYGLNASLWTEDEAFGRRVARRVRAGTVNVNDAYGSTYGSVDAPMGGIGDSGVGRRHGREGLLKYTEPQTVSVSNGGVGPPDGVPYPLYERLLAGALRLMDRVPGLR